MKDTLLHREPSGAKLWSHMLRLHTHLRLIFHQIQIKILGLLPTPLTSSHRCQRKRKLKRGWWFFPLARCWRLPISPTEPWFPILSWIPLLAYDGGIFCPGIHPGCVPSSYACNINKKKGIYSTGPGSSALSAGRTDGPVVPSTQPASWPWGRIWALGI